MAMALSISMNAAAADIDGVWHLQNADNTQAQLDEAVESVVKEMNFFIRALARPVLKKQTQICQDWKLSSTPDQFMWQCDDIEADTISVTAQGEVIKVDDEEIEIMGTFKETSDSVITILESERGIRTNTWQQVSDNELLYTTKLESEKLPKPLTWTLSYKKQ
ncbi:hypothetical protein I8J31_02125 [Marinomonas sp. C1424]|uniref:Uncharacterized protein n=2 Tax=Marinomonas transparens TaxID=2795388 RepID=A0A934JLC0_9GAMM|nr:hypothetical protein [Marinomonas transparens]